jgi:transcriptional regulator with XRE-family HTH domain
MRLRDRERLGKFMDANGIRQSDLARAAGVSRQFVHMLLRGNKRSCSDGVARRIEEGLHVVPGTLFVPEKSTSERRPVQRI